jgi:serine/threonine-protein kinase
MNHVLSIGEKLGGRYEIRTFLDAGGMQEVYVAHDQLLDRDVALKTPFTKSGSKRFKRSAVLAAKMNHPNVAKTLDYFEDSGREILVEELIVGRSVEHLLDEEYQCFDPHLAAQFGHHFAKALQASHAVGVVHRDLKPSNIIAAIDAGLFEFKVTDFGIARLVEEELEKAVDENGSLGTAGSSTIVGALPYMAPEMIQTPKQTDRPVDIWAFGAILYRLMSGDYPFGTGLAAVPKIYAAEAPTKPPLIDGVLQYRALGNALWDIAIKCMSKDPAARPDANTLVTLFSELSYGTRPRLVAYIANASPKGYRWGFLSDGAKKYFFHHDSFYGSQEQIKAGTKVSCCVQDGGGNARAHPVLPLRTAEGGN